MQGYINLVCPFLLSQSYQRMSNAAQKDYRFALGFGSGSVRQENLRVIFMDHGIEASLTCRPMPRSALVYFIRCIIIYCSNKLPVFQQIFATRLRTKQLTMMLLQIWYPYHENVCMAEDKKMLSAQSIWIQRIQMMPTRFLKVKMMEVFKKTLPRYRLCVHRISTTARLLFTN